MNPFFNQDNENWYSLQTIRNKSFICGYCSDKVSSNQGYPLNRRSSGHSSIQQIGGIYICPNCLGPTFFPPSGARYPVPALGTPVSHVPNELNALYEEARRCTSQSCFTAAVQLCRKMLMNIAVHQGAKEGLKFIEYVNYLSDNGFIPPNGKHWVDHIRKKGNEATHEIALMKETDAKELLVFTEMLLKFIYEFPSMVASPSP